MEGKEIRAVSKLDPCNWICPHGLIQGPEITLEQLFQDTFCSLKSFGIMQKLQQENGYTVDRRLLKSNSGPYFAGILAMWWWWCWWWWHFCWQSLFDCTEWWLTVKKGTSNKSRAVTSHYLRQTILTWDEQIFATCQEKCFKSNASRWFNLPLLPWERINLRWTNIYHFLDLFLFCP